MLAQSLPGYGVLGWGLPAALRAPRGPEAGTIRVCVAEETRPEGSTESRAAPTPLDSGVKAQSSVQETYRGSRDGGFRGVAAAAASTSHPQAEGSRGLLPRSPNAPATHLVPSPLRSQGPAQADARVAERQECAGLRSSGLGEAQAWETQGRECAAPRGGGLEGAEAE